jgi:hypothetical protein
MITFGVWRGNDAQGGMRYAFPAYGPYLGQLQKRILQEVHYIDNIMNMKEQ